MNQKLTILLLAILWISCTSKADKTEKIATAPASKEKVLDVPPITNDMINKMINEVDYIDYIFHNLPISVSQDEKASINSNIVFIKNEAVKSIPLDCKPIGRKFYNIKGETYLTADIYFGKGCAVYVFLEGEKPIYANAITEQGITFYNQILEAGKNAK